MFFKHCVWAVLRRDRIKYVYFENYVYERAFLYVHALGFLFEQIKRADRLFTELPPPATVTKFPSDLKQPGLVSKGIYEDGWMAETAEVKLSGREPLSILRVTGLRPGIGDKALKFAVLVDGILLGERILAAGEFVIEAVVEKAGSHWVKMVADSTTSLPAPDGRVVSILLKEITFTKYAR
jgi:hypothetical protein